MAISPCIILYPLPIKMKTLKSVFFLYKISSNVFLEPFVQVESVLTYFFVRCGTFAFQTTL